MLTYTLRRREGSYERSGSAAGLSGLSARLAGDEEAAASTAFADCTRLEVHPWGEGVAAEERLQGPPPPRPVFARPNFGPCKLWAAYTLRSGGP